jgi:hypothetical protein
MVSKAMVRSKAVLTARQTTWPARLVITSGRPR